MSSNREKGKEFYESKNYKKAVEYFSLALRDYPLKDLEMIYSNRSAAYMELEEYEKALKDAQSTIIHSPEWSKGYYRKGEALMKMERYREAQEAYTQALKLVSYG